MFVAGPVDTIGGGGWSAITATMLLARGLPPGAVIGSVHLAKSVVSVAASVSFLLAIGVSHALAVLGLIIGGAVVAPFGALFVRRVPARVATTLEGLAVLVPGLGNTVRLFT